MDRNGRYEWRMRRTGRCGPPWQRPLRRCRRRKPLRWPSSRGAWPRRDSKQTFELKKQRRRPKSMASCVAPSLYAMALRWVMPQPLRPRHGCVASGAPAAGGALEIRSSRPLFLGLRQSLGGALRWQRGGGCALRAVEAEGPGARWQGGAVPAGLPWLRLARRPRLHSSSCQVAGPGESARPAQRRSGPWAK